MDTVVEHIRHLADSCRPNSCTDKQLLERFIGRKDEAAFTALVQRHGPMIFGLCLRLLQHVQDAEDVFQATILVLARKSASIRKQESIGSWLYGVAYRLALKSKTVTARQLARNPVSSRNPVSQGDPLSEITWREVCKAIDEELARLPERCRAPLVLCYLEGKTQDEAQHQLGWSKSTFRRRLEEGRTKLCLRLTRRGITLSAGLWATLLCDPLRALSDLPHLGSPGAALVHSTIKSAIPFAAGEATAVSAHVTFLAKEALKAAAISKMKWAAVVGMATILTTGIGLAAHQVLTNDAATHQPRELIAFADQARNQPKPDKAKQPRLDLYGDPLPKGAIARLGTMRWRTDGHGIDAMAVAVDGKSLLTANTETGITIWDMATGKPIQRIPEKPDNHKEWFGQRRGQLLLALSGDGSRGFFMPADDASIHVIDIATRKEIQNWKNPKGLNQRVVVSRDGKILVTRSLCHVQIWSTDSGKLLRELKATPKQENGQSKHEWLALSADGKTLAWVGEDNACPIHVVDVATGEERHELGQYDKGERQIVMSPNGQWLVSTSGGGSVQLWDLNSGRLAHKWAGKEDTILPMAGFSPDSQKLVLTRPGEAMRVLDVANGKELWRVPRQIVSTAQDFYAFTPDGKTLMTAGAALGTVIHRYDMARGKRLLAPGEPSDTSTEIAFHPNERTVYTLGADGSVLRSWETRTGKEKSEVRLDVRWAKFSPNGQLLAGIKGDELAVLESSTGRELYQLKAVPPVEPSSWSFSPDDKLLAVYGKQTQGELILIWNLTTGKELRRFSVKDSLRLLAFAPDGQSVIGQPWPSDSNKNALLSWDVPTGQERPALALPLNRAVSSLSPDGRTVVLMPYQVCNLEFVEVATGEKRMEIHPLEVYRIVNWLPTATYSPDGRLFIISDGEGQMQVFDWFGGQRLGTISGNSGSFSSYSFSQSGRTLATMSSSDTTGLIWDANTIFGRLRPGPLELPPDNVSSLWQDLASKDATRAFLAVGRLSLAQRQAIAWFREHLKPFSTGQINNKRLDQLLTDLDNDKFAVREQATKEIERFGLPALPALEKALARNPSAEVLRRIETLIERIGPERIRPLRAIEVLEHIGTQEAQDLLKKLAIGAPEARLTQEAKASLVRLQIKSEPGTK